ncbi:MAG TPA: secondary thiamine-phosphate synthase enzyme YjbQ [Candidatus Peribacterales bacterium]|nr:secondary thiamine-phosphate synthase enzyme YjbQ [Candidatus Peribacterales bacterium]
MERLSFSTSRKKQILDITDQVNERVHASGKIEGLCYLHILHTTAALTTADLDPGTDLDMLDAFEAMIPKLNYRHPHDPSHVGDHIMSSIIGSSVLLPFSQGNLILGTWQRIVLVELDGPRERGIILTFL